MVHSDGIWNDLEMQRKKIKTRTVNGAFRRCLKQFGIEEKILKNRAGKGCILTAFETVLNYGKYFENKYDKWFILTVFGTIWNIKEHFGNKDSKWCILTVFGTADIILKQGRFLVYYDTFWNDILKLQWEKQNMFCLHQVRCEVGRPQSWFFVWKQGRWVVHSDAIWNDISEIPRTFWKQGR